LLFDAAGHLALWPALYAGAVLCCFLQLAGLWRGGLPDFIAVGSVVCTAMGTYLIDRVKLLPQLADPSDRLARPRRYAFLDRYDTLARLLSVASLTTGAMLAAQLNRWAPLLVLLSIIGITLYAPHPRRQRPRLKDVLLIKNLYTAAGLVAFATIVSVLTWLPGYRPIGWLHLLKAPAMLWAVPILLIQVLLDTILCDVDDEHADRKFQTQTLVSRFGKTRAIRYATIAELLLACAIPLLPFAPIARVAWSGSIIAGTILSLRAEPKFLKDFVDLRFPVAALIITLILAFR
jgi:4-hydroxybenzoate polyprenyltransferase